MAESGNHNENRYSISDWNNSRDFSRLKAVLDTAMGFPLLQTDERFFSYAARIRRTFEEENIDRNFYFVNLNFKYLFPIAALTDTFQVLIRDPSDDNFYHEIFSFNIIDQLTLEEKSYVDYLKGIIKMAKNKLSANVGHNSISDIAIESEINLIKNDLFPTSADEVAIRTQALRTGIEAVSMKFPEIKRINNRVYFHSDEVFVAEPQENSQIPIPCRNDLLRVFENFGSYLIAAKNENTMDFSEAEESFRRVCLESLSNYNDPLQPFNKFNPIFANEGNVQEDILNEDEIRLITKFMSKAETTFINPGPYANSRFRNPRAYLSGLRKARAYHNYKSFNKTLLLSRYSTETIENRMFFCFVKKGKNNKIVGRIGLPENLSDNINSSLGMIQPSRKNKFTSPPVVVRDPRDPSRLQISHVDSLESESDRIYFMTRPVSVKGQSMSVKSYSEISEDFYNFYSSDSVYQCREISSVAPANAGGIALSDGSVAGSTTELEEELSADFNIQRILMTRGESGEYLVHSKVIKNNFSYHRYLDQVSNLEDQLRGITAHGFCISDVLSKEKDHYTPMNVIKICNIPKNLKIQKVTFFHGLTLENLDAGKEQNLQLLAFFDDNGTIPHSDPIPDQIYTYTIHFMEKYSGVIAKDATIQVKIKTLNPVKNRIDLVKSGIHQDDVSDYYAINIVGSNLESYRENFINASLDKLFPDNDPARETYVDLVKGKLNENLSLVASSFELMVTKYDKNSGELINRTILQSESGESGDISFKIRIPRTNRSMLISYNLIIINPLHDGVIEAFQFDEVVEGDDVNRTRFLRKTSKYFNTTTANRGLLPGPNRPPSGNLVVQAFNNFGDQDKFNKLTCIGDVFEHTENVSSSTYSWDQDAEARAMVDGEFFIRWQIGVPENIHRDCPEFFVVTCSIWNGNNYGAEFPIASHPYITDNSGLPLPCVVRTRSFKGVAGSLKFTVYIVDNNFKILQNKSETPRIAVKCPEHYDTLASDFRVLEER